MNQRQKNDYWIGQLFKAQEITLNPPCRCHNFNKEVDYERCEPAVCQEAARMTASALKVLGKSGYPGFLLGN